MNTILFTWNPSKWPWDDLPQAVAAANVDGRHMEEWNCVNARRIAPGDRAFLVRLGLAPKGIVGSGVVVTQPKEHAHWDPDRANAGDTCFFVEILFDVLSATPLIDEKILSLPPLSPHNWYPHASGTSIPSDIATVLEDEWTKVTGTSFAPLSETELPTLYFEGTKRTRQITEFERNPEARKKCIEHYGTRCTVCKLAFDERYGQIGAGFIHVHHLVPMSAIGDEYEVDPIHDLCPVCPNCHAMLHKQTPPFTPNELTERIGACGVGVGGGGSD